MIKVLPLFALLVLWMPGTHCQAVSVRASGISVEGRRHFLDMVVENCTNRGMAVSLPDLPWGQHRLGLVLYRAGKVAGDPMRETVIVGDDPMRTVVIPANGQVDGRVDLDYRFPALTGGADLQDLVLFWVYDVSLISGGKSRFSGGMIPIVPDGSRPETTPNVACGSSP